MELAVQILHSALCVDVPTSASSPHWVLQCSPFPLLYVLAQHLNQVFRSTGTIAVTTFFLALSVEFVAL